MGFFILFILAYLSGSVPYGFLVARFKGIDIRKVGSGNIGGTNVSRALGIKWGALVGLLDVLKSFIPAYLAVHFLTNPWQIVFVLAAPVLGHVFPVWLRFKGGKGVACLLGTLLALFPVWQIIVVILIWATALKLVKIMSLVNIMYVLVLPVVLWEAYHLTAYVVYGLFIISLIWYAHRSNIRRLRKGTELKLSI